MNTEKELFRDSVKFIFMSRYYRFRYWVHKLFIRLRFIKADEQAERELKDKIWCGIVVRTNQNGYKKLLVTKLLNANT